LNEVPDTNRAREAMNWYQWHFKNGTATFTFPSDDKSKKPSPFYHSIEWMKVIFLNWELMVPGLKLCCTHPEWRGLLIQNHSDFFKALHMATNVWLRWWNHVGKRDELFLKSVSPKCFWCRWQTIAVTSIKHSPRVSSWSKVCCKPRLSPFEHFLRLASRTCHYRCKWGQDCKICHEEARYTVYKKA
jgi:hypothetical protein